ncbi:hypothetical protein C6W24_15790 [Bacillus atrophaeus]|nr:hypothetical protein C6W24_15790 [Bacillus atrophaeus]
MSDMPGNGENDRLGLSKKTLDYEKVKGKEAKLEEKPCVCSSFFLSKRIPIMIASSQKKFAVIAY